MKKLFLILSLCWPSFASAKVFLRPMGLYSYFGTKSDGSASYGSSRIVTDLGAGYMSEKGWIYGFLYQIDSMGGGSRTSMGPSFGWSSIAESGPFLVGHYFFKSSYGGFGSSGWGYQADLGLRVPLRRVHLAVQLSYKSYTSKSGISGQFSSTHTYIDPAIGLFISF